MNILFFNMNEYSEWKTRGIPNRNRHVFFDIAKRKDVDTVVAVDFMPFTLKRAVKVWLANILKKNEGEVMYRTFFDSMVMVSDNTYVFSSVRSLFGEKYLYASLDKALGLIHFKADVLWSYFPYFVGYLDHYDRIEKKIFDVVDDWSEHENFKKVKKYLKGNYTVIENKSDIIFTVSKGLIKLFPTHKNVRWIPNGVDFDHFNSKNECESYVLDQIRAFQNPIFGYVGVIQKRIDFELVARAAERHTHAQFVFVGPVWPDAEVHFVKKLNNVHFLGSVSYDILPSVIHEFDVGIIPHKVNAFTASMNPLKLYEYLAAGIPVVTTKVAGLDDFKDIILIADMNSFAEMLSKAITREELSKKEIRRKRARKHSWTSRIEKMMKLLADSL